MTSKLDTQKVLITSALALSGVGLLYVLLKNRNTSSGSGARQITRDTVKAVNYLPYNSGPNRF